MYGKAATIFYSLAIFVLGTTFFLIRPSDHQQIVDLQNSIEGQLRVAFIQTWGDQPYLTEVALVFQGVSDFYKQAAESTISLVQDKEADRDIAFIFISMFERSMIAFGNTAPSNRVAADVSDFQVLTPFPTSYTAPVGTRPAQSGVVSGKQSPDVANVDEPWVTLQDNLTGQLYCLAIYNGEINKYLGPCAYDYH